MREIITQLRKIEEGYRYRCIATPADSSLYEVLDELRTFTINLAQILEQAQAQKERSSDPTETVEREGPAEVVLGQDSDRV